MKEEFKVGDRVKQVMGDLAGAGGVITAADPDTFNVMYDGYYNGVKNGYTVIYSQRDRGYFAILGMPQDNNQVSHPKHYNEGKIEVIEFIEDKKLNFHKGNAIKYISRAGIKNKDKEIEDLEKAIWYLKREIECLKADKDGREAIKPNDMKG